MSRWPVLFHRLKGRAARETHRLVTAVRGEKTPSLVFLDGPSLYDDYSFFQSHFTWDGTRAADDKLLYHCYWAGTLTRHHELSLESLLVTQSPPFEVWLWLPPEDIARNQSFLSRFSSLKCVRVREYVPEREAEGTRCAGRADLLSPTSTVEASNCLRTLVAWKYGGVYFDLDVLFLRDLRPLCGVEFFYQWSDQPYGNSALIHFRRQSANARALLDHGVRISSYKPRLLLSFRGLRNVVEGVHVFPAFTFDPLWIAQDRKQTINDYCNTYRDFFEKPGKVGFDAFFPSSYAFHWHNKWTTPIRPGTLAGRLYDEIDAKFRAAYE